MREIKFRAWDADKQQVRYPEVMNISQADLLARFSTVMQFTGLLDKNGKEIYEGDLIRVCYYECEDEPELNSFSNHEVVWGGEYPAFDLKPPIDDMMNGLQAIGFGAEDCPLWCEVIGNIYEDAVAKTFQSFAAKHGQELASYIGEKHD